MSVRSQNYLKVAGGIILLIIGLFLGNVFDSEETEELPFTNNGLLTKFPTFSFISGAGEADYQTGLVMDIDFDNLDGRDQTGIHADAQAQGSAQAINNRSACLWYNCSDGTTNGGDYWNVSINTTFYDGIAVSYWIKPTVAPTTDTAMYYQFLSDTCDEFFTQEGDFGPNTKWCMNNGSVDVVLGENERTTANVWTHHFIQYDEDRFVFWVNGVVKRNVSADFGDFNLTVGDELELMRGRFGIDLRGYFDEWQMWNVSNFQTSDVQEIYNEKKSGTPPDRDISIGSEFINATSQYKYNYSDPYNRFNMSGTIPYVVEIKNYGVLSTTNISKVEVRDTDNTTVLCTGDVLLGGQSSVNYSCALPKRAGLHVYHLYIDMDGNVSEDDETNNYFKLPVNFDYISMGGSTYWDVYRPWVLTDTFANDQKGGNINFNSEDFNPSWTCEDVDPRGKKGFENAISCVDNNYSEGGNSYCSRLINHLDGWLSLDCWADSEQSVQAIHMVETVGITYEIAKSNLTQTQLENYAVNLTRICNELMNHPSYLLYNDEFITDPSNGPGFGLGAAYPCAVSLGDDVNNPFSRTTTASIRNPFDSMELWVNRIIRNHLYDEYGEGSLYTDYMSVHKTPLLIWLFRNGAPYNVNKYYNDGYCAPIRNYAYDILEYDSPDYSGGSISSERNIERHSFGDTFSEQLIGESDHIGAAVMDGYIYACEDPELKKVGLWVREKLGDVSSRGSDTNTRFSLFTLYHLQNVTAFNDSEMQDWFNNNYYTQTYDRFHYRQGVTWVNDTYIRVDGGTKGVGGHLQAEFFMTVYTRGVNFLMERQVPNEDVERPENFANTMSTTNATTGAFISNCDDVPFSQQYGGELEYNVNDWTIDSDYTPEACRGSHEEPVVNHSLDFFQSFMTQPYDISHNDQERLIIHYKDIRVDNFRVRNNGSSQRIYFHWLNVDLEVNNSASGDVLTITAVNQPDFKYEIDSITSGMTLSGEEAFRRTSRVKTGSPNQAAFYNRWSHYKDFSDNDHAVFVHQDYDATKDSTITSSTSNGDILVQRTEGSEDVFVILDTNNDGVVAHGLFNATARALTYGIDGSNYAVQNATSVTYNGTSLFIGSSQSFMSDSGSNFSSPSDTTAPQILSATNISTTNVSTTIRVVTDESANLSVNFSDGNKYTQTDFATTQDVSITGLTPSTNYTYNVTVWDASGNTNSSTGYSFLTADSPSGNASECQSFSFYQNIAGTDFTIYSNETIVLNSNTACSFDSGDWTQGPSTLI